MSRNSARDPASDSQSMHSDRPATAAAPINRPNATFEDDPSPRDLGGWLSGSPHSFSRAGLLQPKSYSSSRFSRPGAIAFTHTQEDIRDHTMQLSSIPLRPTSPQTTPADQAPNSQPAFIFPSSPPAEDAELPPSLSASITSASESPVDLSASSSTLSSTQEGVATPRLRSGSFHPSGLSLALSRQAERRDSSALSDSDSRTPTPTNARNEFITSPSSRSSVHLPPAVNVGYSFSGTPRISFDQDVPLSSERQPLLGDVEAGRPTYGDSRLSNGHSVPSNVPTKGKLNSTLRRLKQRVTLHNVEHVATDAVKSLPAVLLGTLLNILDGVSYGMIIFPAAGVFTNLGGVGVSMFFVSAVISQLVYSFGASGFAGANGSMMIEVVPFFHILATSIANDIGEDNPHAVLATTMVAFALSSILTGLSFFLLGALRLGSLIGFFPRHILVGCIGGVGVFLIVTGLTVCTRMPDDDFDLTLSTFKFLFLNMHNLIMWLPAFTLAVLLRVITHKFNHQLIFPLYFIIIPLVFYIVVASARLDLGVLRTTGWLFDMETADEPWYRFYTLYDFSAVNWPALWATLPTQFALLFFNILHPPLNVPALAVSLNHDVDTDKELVAHGYSNLLAGIIGTVPNYLVYVNTLLFYRVGGDTRVSGFLLAGATALLLFVGTGPIAFIPVMVVGALIFVLGIDLVKEALWDTRHRVNKSEYLTIASIMVAMTVWDFVIGVIFGIVVSCFFFVVQSSRRKSIRALYTGETAISSVRRPSAHRAYLREVSRQTMILRLQGFLFFGTITQVEETIREMMEGAAWQHSPIRFLVLDLTLVAGVDMSAAEAFVRVQRILSGRGVVLVLCGFSPESAVALALQCVDLFEMNGVETFATFSDALEWTENAYLRAWFMSQKVETDAVVVPGRQNSIAIFEAASWSSPRKTQILDAGFRTIAKDHSTVDDMTSLGSEPYNILIKAFSSYGPVDRETFIPLVSYLERIAAPEGYVLWKQGDEPDGLYIIESGILRASYSFTDHTEPTYEMMVPGTIAGELSTLSNLERNATCTVERAAVLWKLSSENLQLLHTEHPQLARTLVQLVLKAAKLDYDILLSALASRH